MLHSGDDRDYCEVVHETVSHDTDTKREIREVTVKSFSPSRHIRWPGFQLISLISPDPGGQSGPTIADTSCYLPDTRTMYKSIYLPSLVFTAIVLLYINIKHRRHHRRISSLSSVPLRRSSGPASAVWSACSPRPKFVTSPMSPLPPNSRVPSSRAPSYRASPLSYTPQGSPLLSPIALFPTENETEDPLSPAQYSARRDHHDGHNGTWTIHENEEEPSKGTAFLPAPWSPRNRTKWWSWTRSFEWNGRRRRITFSVPCWDACHKYFSSSVTSLLWGQGLISRVACDIARVAIPATIVRVVLLWLIF